MRRFVPLALLALAVSPALAQTQYADSAGVYLQLNTVGISRNVQSFDGGIGARFNNGTDAGLQVAAESGPSYGGFRIGPTAGITRPLGSGFIGRAEGSVQYLSNTGTVAPYNFQGVVTEGFDYRFRDLRQDVSATVGRRIGIIGSVAFQPALGGYVVTRQRLTYENPRAGGEPARADYTAGVQIEIPITFRLFGRDAAIAPVTRFSLTGTPYLGDATLSGGGFRLNL